VTVNTTRGQKGGRGECHGERKGRGGNTKERKGGTNVKQRVRMTGTFEEFGDGRGGKDSGKKPPVSEGCHRVEGPGLK